MMIGRIILKSLRLLVLERCLLAEILVHFGAASIGNSTWFWNRQVGLEGLDSIVGSMLGEFLAK